MSGSGKCKENLNFCVHYGSAEINQAKVLELLRKVKKKLGAAERKKLKLSALAFQSVEFFLFRESKIQMLTTFAGI